MLQESVFGTVSMQKPNTNNKSLPTRLPPMEGQEKEIQYPGWHKDTTQKGLWIGEDEVLLGDLRK